MDLDGSVNGDENKPLIQPYKPDLESVTDTYGTSDNVPKRKHTASEILKVDFVWKNIRYVIPATKDTPEKVILNNVSGYTRPGHMCALMGSSGAGKTTLLDVLSGRLAFQKGQLMINNVEVGSRTIRKISSYVMQEDRLGISFTVRETLLFYTNLKVSMDTTDAEKDAIVDSILKNLGLEKAKDTIIGGGNLRGISGGEKRRVSIGIELITSPSIIFLDEPTSGLDSSNAFTIMTMLRKLADGGRIIISSIHQPRPDIFYLMDNVLLLSEGSTFYFGPSSLWTSYTSYLGYECPETMNPADHMLDLVTPGSVIRGHSDILRKEDIQILQQRYTSSDICKKMESDIQTPSMYKPISDAEVEAYKKRPSIYHQMKMLVWRNVVGLQRNSAEGKARAYVLVIQYLICGFVFFDLPDSNTGFRARIGVIFFVITACTVASVTHMMPVFPIERELIMHERRNGYYSLVSYYLSRLITDRITLVIYPVLSTSILYPLVGLRDGFDHIFKFFLAMFMAFNVSHAMGLFIGSIVPSVSVGSIFGPLVAYLFILFSGYFVAFSEMPSSLEWLSSLSSPRWALQASTINEFEDAYDYSNTNKTCSFLSGNDVIDYYEYDDYTYTECIVFSLLLFVAFSILLFVSLYIRDRYKNSSH